MIEKCGGDLTKNVIEHVFNSPFIKDKLDMYRALLEYVPYNVVLAISFKDRDLQDNFVKNIAKAEMEESLENFNNDLAFEEQDLQKQINPNSKTSQLRL